MNKFTLKGHLTAAMAAMLLTFTGANAEPINRYDGSVGSFTNDAIGDGRDRWQSASYQRSYLYNLDDIKAIQQVEWRARAQIVSPWTSSKQPVDRPYSSVLAFGGFARGHVAGLENHLGGEIIMQGDQTGLPAFQSAAHDALGLDKSYDPDNPWDTHVPDRFTVRGEAGLATSLRPSPGLLLRPYGLVAVGADQSATVGADVVIGPMAQADSWTRDVVSGQLLTHQNTEKRGVSLVAGADISRVYASMHIPEDSKVEPEEIQARVRLGGQFNLGAVDIFFGQTWLSEGFVGQSETQRVGNLSVSLNF
jgi:hypothetical protein